MEVFLKLTQPYYDRLLRAELKKSDPAALARLLKSDVTVPGTEQRLKSDVTVPGTEQRQNGTNRRRNGRKRPRRTATS